MVVPPSNFGTCSSTTENFPLLEDLFLSWDKRFVMWKYNNKGKKVALDPKTYRFAEKGYSWNTSHTWIDYETFLKQRAIWKGRKFNGVALVLHENNPFPLPEIVLLDFDDVHKWEEEQQKRLFDFIESYKPYCEWSPSGKGLRIILAGSIPKVGKQHLYTFMGIPCEAFDRNSNTLCTITRNFYDEGYDLLKPTSIIPDFDDLLIPRESVEDKHRCSATHAFTPTSPIPEYMEETRDRVIGILKECEATTDPIQAPGRYNQLLSIGALVWKRSGMSAEQHSDFLSDYSNTMSYDEEGDLSPLEDHKLEKIYKANTSLPRGHEVSNEVRTAVRSIETFLYLIIDRVPSKYDVLWQLVYGLIQQAKKSGDYEDGAIHVDCSWRVLKEFARISGTDTFRKHKKDLSQIGIFSSVSWQDKITHFSLYTSQIVDPERWGISCECVNEQYQYIISKRGIDIDTPSFPHILVPAVDTLREKFDPIRYLYVEIPEPIRRISKPTYHNEPCWTDVKVAAFLTKKNCKKSAGVTAAEVSEIVGINRTTAVQSIKRLERAGVVKKRKKKGRSQPYGVNINKVADRFDALREQSEESEKDRKLREDHNGERLWNPYIEELTKEALKGDDGDVYSVSRPDGISEEDASEFIHFELPHRIRTARDAAIKYDRQLKVLDDEWWDAKRRGDVRTQWDLALRKEAIHRKGRERYLAPGADQYLEGVRELWRGPRW